MRSEKLKYSSENVVYFYAKHVLNNMQLVEVFDQGSIIIDETTEHFWNAKKKVDSESFNNRFLV